MRMLMASVVVLLGLAVAGEARADHPFSFLRKNHCQDQSCGHKLWPFGGHKLFGGHGHPFHKPGGCDYHPWFNTYKQPLDPSAAFPVHPFVRGPRDFFMYQ